MPFWIGQSVGVIPPGTDPRTGKPYRPRLYSIASTRKGADGTGLKLSLCVGRFCKFDPVSGAAIPGTFGVSSSFLCSAVPGTPVSLTGPVGRLLLLPCCCCSKKTRTHEGTDAHAASPEPCDAPSAQNPSISSVEDSYSKLPLSSSAASSTSAACLDCGRPMVCPPLVMIATGTGLAPFMAFLRRLLEENPSSAPSQLLLLLGHANARRRIYADTLEKLATKHSSVLTVKWALSREMKNKAGNRMYVQDLVEEHSNQVLTMMEDGGHIYLCGLKSMVNPVAETLTAAAQTRANSAELLLKNWKKQKRWHQEVY
eukprot:GHVT01072520.1.p1 GENE.GHVT01072520.1~~GHVT01072520.1.p1  ORF type:complete len:313 (-),score=59.15 GHVT01072520.1:1303-2241(-)